MHDRDGNPVKPGDRVYIPGVIKECHPGDYCSCTVVTEEKMPGNGTPTEISAINTRQVVLTNPPQRDDDDWSPPGG